MLDVTINLKGYDCCTLGNPKPKKMLIFRFVGIFEYEGCQESSWTPIVKASNEPDFDIHHYISLK